MKKMFLKLVLFCLCLLGLVGRGALTPKDQQDEAYRLLPRRYSSIKDMVTGFFEASGDKFLLSEGGSFTLGYRLRKMKSNDVIQWRFNIYNLLAQINKPNNSTTVYDVLDGRFRDRLKLDDQTGSLTIKNITAEHTGPYNLYINGRKMKTYQLHVQSKPVSVMEGDSVTLNSGLTKITDHDLIEWSFVLGNLVEFSKRDDRITVYEDVHDGRFRDRLKLDKQTGSLTITNISTEHAGVYRLRRTGGLYSSKIIGISLHNRLPVPVINRDCSSSSSSEQNCSLVCSVVNVGRVTLSWYKGNSLLISISVYDPSISLSLALEVEYQDKNSYSCVFNNTISKQTQHLDITQLCQPCPESKSATAHTPVTVKVGGSVTLNSGLTDIRNIDLIQWETELNGILIAEINNLEVNLYYGPNGRFRGRLNLDHQTGSLTITNITNEDSGYYIKKINGVTENVHVSTLNEISVKEGDNATLNSGFTLDKSDYIFWNFVLNDKLEVLIDKVATYKDAINGRYSNRLKMDQNTGTLTIRNITTEDAGFYVLETLYMFCLFNVTVYDSVKL